MDKQQEAVKASRHADDEEVDQHPSLLLVDGAEVQGIQCVLPKRTHQL